MDIMASHRHRGTARKTARLKSGRTKTTPMTCLFIRSHAMTSLRLNEIGESAAGFQIG